MRAAVYRRFGPPEVVEIVELPKPVPSDDEVLIRVRATTVTAGDWRMRSAILPPGFGLLAPLALGFSKPRKAVLGTELAGDVEAVGASVHRFKVGDKVFAFCGLNLGCHAEYRCVRQDEAILPLPAGLTYEQAAALSFGGTTALYFLRDLGRVQAGERVLINGASGGVGSAAVQIARHVGAEVTGICSAANAELVRSLGAEHVIDYAKEDVARSGKTFDVILDAVGNCPFAKCQALLAPGGRFLMVVGSLGENLGAVFRPSRSGRRIVRGVAPERAEDLRFLAGLAEAGKYKAVIDRVYPFERIVEAHAHVDSGHKKGNVVVTLA